MSSIELRCVSHMMNREGLRFNTYHAPEMIITNLYHLFKCCETSKEADSVQNVLLSMDEDEKKVMKARKFNNLTPFM